MLFHQLHDAQVEPLFQRQRLAAVAQGVRGQQIAGILRTDAVFQLDIRRGEGRDRLATPVVDRLALFGGQDEGGQEAVSLGQISELDLLVFRKEGLREERVEEERGDGIHPVVLTHREQFFGGPDVKGHLRLLVMPGFVCRGWVVQPYGWATVAPR